MSEVSREVAIIVLDNEKNHLWQGKEETRNDAYDKAISDMDKLQKIESLYGIDKFGKVLTREERDSEVQKILECE